LGVKGLKINLLTIFRVPVPVYGLSICSHIKRIYTCIIMYIKFVAPIDAGPGWDLSCSQINVLGPYALWWVNLDLTQMADLPLKW